MLASDRGAAASTRVTPSFCLFAHPLHLRLAAGGKRKPCRPTLLHALGHSQATDLWSYSTTHVRPIAMDSFRLMHRASFNHRNLRTYVVVVYVPGSTKCAEVEHQIERLATGLSHEPRVLVAKLNALGDSDTFLFATSVMEVKQYPTIFLYPEGTPGYMRFTGADVTAENLLSAVNACYRQVLGGHKQLELSGAPGAGQQPSTSAQETIQRQQQEQQQHAGGPDSKVETLQHEPVVRTLASVSQGYWSPGKVAFWGFIVLFSVGAFCWDRWGEDWWLERGLRERQRKRLQEGVHYDEETNMDDVLSLTLLGAGPVTKAQAIQQVGEDKMVEGDTGRRTEGPGSRSPGDRTQ